MLISHEKKLGICYYTKKEKKKEEKGHFRQGHFGFGLVRVHHSLHLRSPALVQQWQVDNHH
jgi:hypothetical protein